MPFLNNQPVHPDFFLKKRKDFQGNLNFMTINLKYVFCGLDVFRM